MSVDMLSKQMCGLWIVPPPLPNVTVWQKPTRPVPLTGVAADVSIHDAISSVTLTQHYTNVEKDPIEAVYIFPLDPKSSVCEFEAEVDGKVFKGVVKESVKALEEYNEAVYNGDGAYLLEKKKGDIFQMAVGNLLPGKEAIIRISYVSELDNEEGDLRFCLPTTIAPRYTPGGATPAPEPPREYLSSEQRYGMSLNMAVSMSKRITRVISPSHELQISVQDNNATVAFKQGVVELDKDIVVTISIEQAHEPRVIVEKYGGSYAAALILWPHFGVKQVPGEYVFIIDRSGSMSGQKISDAKAALHLFMRSLPMGSYFNAISFGTRYNSLWRSSRAYDEHSLKEATEYVDRMEADMGGTNLLEPLLSAFNTPKVAAPGAGVQGSEPTLLGTLVNMLTFTKPSGAELPRNVFVLTDGEVSNTSQIIAEVKGKASETCRLFSLGIGNAVSRELVSGVADAGKGLALYAMEGERLESKVVLLLKHASCPALKDVRVVWKTASDRIVAVTGLECSMTTTSHRAPGEQIKDQGIRPSPVHRQPGVAIPPPAHASPQSTSTSSPTPQVMFVPDQEIQNVLDWRTAPYVAPPIFTDTIYRSYLLMEPKTMMSHDLLPTKVLLTGKAPDGQLDATVPVDMYAAFEGKAVHALAARALVADIELKQSLYDKLWSTNYKQSDIDAELVRVGEKYSIVSSRTSFVAVEQRTQEQKAGFNASQIKPRMVPQHEPTPPVRRMRGAMPMMMAMPAAPMAPCMSGGGGGPMRSMARMERAPMKKKMAFAPTNAPVCDMAPEYEEVDEECMSVESSVSAPSRGPPAPAPKSSAGDRVSVLRELVRLQAFDGSYPDDSRIYGLLNVQRERAIAVMPHTTPPAAVVTALVLAYFTKCLGDLSDEWDLIALKARQYLGQLNLNIQVLVSAAEGLL